MLPYARQLLVKRAQVDDALRRIGRLDGFELEEIVPALEQWRYRNKLEYSFGAGPDGSLVCGFHAPAGGNSVVSIEDCLLASEQGNLAREAALALVSCAGPRRLGARRRSRESCERRSGSGRGGWGPIRTGARACATWSCAKAGARGNCKSGSSRQTASSRRAPSRRR